MYNAQTTAGSPHIPGLATTQSSLEGRAPLKVGTDLGRVLVKVPVDLQTQQGSAQTLAASRTQDRLTFLLKCLFWSLMYVTSPPSSSLRRLCSFWLLATLLRAKLRVSGLDPTNHARHHPLCIHLAHHAVDRVLARLVVRVHERVAVPVQRLGRRERLRGARQCRAGRGRDEPLLERRRDERTRGEAERRLFLEVVRVQIRLDLDQVLGVFPLGIRVDVCRIASADRLSDHDGRGATHHHAQSWSFPRATAAFRPTCRYPRSSTPSSSAAQGPRPSPRPRFFRASSRRAASAFPAGQSPWPSSWSFGGRR